MISVNCNFYFACFKPLGIACCVALFSVLIAGGPLNCAKSDTDFGGQRYVKQAEFCGLSEG
jgi:hypothetical protein